MTPDYKKIIEHVLGADFINATQKNASFSFPKPLITVDKNLTKITRDIEKLRFSLVGYPLRNTILKDYDTINSLVYPRNSLMNTSLNIALESIKNNRFHCQKIKPIIPIDYDLSFKTIPPQEPNTTPPLIIVLQNSPTTNPPSQSSHSVKREHNKLQTREMYKTWGKKYKEIKKEYPHLSNSDIAKKIAKMPISQGKSAETIRKNMKK